METGRKEEAEEKLVNNEGRKEGKQREDRRGRKKERIKEEKEEAMN